MYQLLKLLIVLGFVGTVQGQPPAGENKPSKSVQAQLIQPKVELPKFFNKTITHPDIYLKLALDHQDKLIGAGLIEEVYFTRFVLFNTAPSELLKEFILSFDVTYNTVNTANTLAKPILLEGSEGRLFAIDLRLTRWTVEAFTASVRFDLSLREPHCDGILAEKLRKNAGIQQEVAKEGIAKGTAHVDIIAPGLWFMREILEPGNRTNTYYFLTYPEETFGKTAFNFKKQTLGVIAPAVVAAKKKVKKIVEVDWAGGIWYNDGLNKYYPPKAFRHLTEIEVDEPVTAVVQQSKVSPSYSLDGQQHVNTKVLKNFPEDLQQFQDFWGITDAQKALNKLKQLGTKGEVVEGSKNTKINGSEVSFNDRIVETLVLQGARTYMRTRDFKKTSGKSNPANNPSGVVNGDIEEDAGEHLLSLSHGLQTALLTGGAKEGRKRVEAGDAEVVHSARDTTEVVVKTQIHCFFCHAPTYGVVNFSNRKVTGALRRGIRLFEADLEQKDKNNFFFQEFDEEMDAWRIPYKRAVKTLTGWTGQQLATALKDFRDWYDAPVSLDQAAAELGIQKLPLLFILMAEGSIDSQTLFVEKAIPRAQWDDELYLKLAIAFAASRNGEKPNLLLLQYYPDLIKKYQSK